MKKVRQGFLLLAALGLLTALSCGRAGLGNIRMLPWKCNCTPIYSMDNEALRNVQLGGFGITAERQEVDSVGEYYPGKTSQTP